jgi:hypothetical protein
VKRAIKQETLQAREFRAARSEAYRLELRLGLKWLPVRSRREPVRLWRSLTAVGRFCADVGIKVLTVEL